MTIKTALRVVGSAFELYPGTLYLKSYDPDGLDGRGVVTVTRDLHNALLFDDAIAALELYRIPSTVRPLRPDGRPNRPLTAFTIELVRVEVTPL